MRRNLAGFALSFVLAAGLTATGMATAWADGTWLDAPLTNWNAPGQGVPKATPPQFELDPRCVERARPPESPEEAQVEAQGWRLVGMYQGGWGTRIVTGATEFDGMCRPIGFQTFTFQHGVFAGTISPQTMDSRTDGAAFNVILSSKAPGEVQQVTASFTRYKPEDPLCCASAKTDVSYRITVENGKPVLTPVQATTIQAPREGS